MQAGNLVARTGLEPLTQSSYLGSVNIQKTNEHNPVKFSMLTETLLAE